MKPQAKEVAEVPEEETEEYAPKYDIRAVNGDVYITINASRGSTVNVNRGQIPPTPPPPKGGS